MSTTDVATMSTKQIAKRLKSLCEKGQFEDAVKELFSRDAVSIEPMASAMFEKETHGQHAILAKGKKWNEMVEKNHSHEVSEPLVAGNSFSVTMHLDATMKDGKRMDMSELCVYHVKDGKIISEQFFI